MRAWLAILTIALCGSGATAAGLRSELLVDGAWLSEHLADPAVVVIHVGREPAGYQRGHLPGARFLAVSAVAATRDGLHNEFPPAVEMVRAFADLGLGTTGRIVLYGEDSGIQAARAFVALDYLGAGDRTALLDGGLPAWRVAGRALTTESPRVERGTFAATPRLQTVVSRQVVQDVADLAPAGTKLLDARPPSQYAAGHLPTALSLPWERALVSPELPRLRGEAELRALFAQAAVQPADVTIHYCNSGMQASLGYFVARYLGYDARLYDGSLSDWTAAGLKVTTTAKP